MLVLDTLDGKAERRCRAMCAVWLVTRRFEGSMETEDRQQKNTRKERKVDDARAVVPVLEASPNCFECAKYGSRNRCFGTVAAAFGDVHEQVVLGEITMTAAAIHLLLERDIEIIFLGRYGQVQGPGSRPPSLRMLWCAWRSTERIKI